MNYDLNIHLDSSGLLAHEHVHAYAQYSAPLYPLPLIQASPPSHSEKKR